MTPDRLPPVEYTRDPETLARGRILSRLVDEALSAMTPQERDRLFQRHLAAARGTHGNARALCELVDLLVALRRNNPGPAEPPRREGAE